MDVLRIDALLNDKKVELFGNFGLLPKQLRAEIVPGSNHQARLWKDPHTMGGTLMFQNYQLVFPDRSTWLCVVSGISE
jgi:hypothetical protein